jgi:hypothetical protein
MNGKAWMVLVRSTNDNTTLLVQKALESSWTGYYMSDWASETVTPDIIALCQFDSLWLEFLC